jgi:hypothetical protein
MRFRFNSSGISINIILSSFLIVFFGLCILIFNYKLVENDYLHNNDLNEESFNQSKNKLHFLEFKNEVNQLVLDVNLTSTYVLYRVKQRESIDSKTKFQKIFKLRKNKIEPRIASLNEGLEKYPDEIKSEYNRIIDYIFRLNKIQDDLLRETGKLTDITTSYVDGKISQYTGELNTASSEFLNDYIKETPEVFTKPKYRKDYWGFITISGLLFMVGVIIIIYKSTSYLKSPIRHLESILKNIYEGSIPSVIGLRNKDYLLIGKYIGGINDTLRKLEVFANHVGKGEFDSDKDVKFIEKGKFGEALHNMQESLVNIAKEDSQRSHVNEGLARFSDILGNNSNNLECFGDDVILNLVQFLNANQGALFVLNEEDEGVSLGLTSCYAYDKKKYLDREVVKGQGLIGQCWQEGKRIYMTDVPSDYINITSGLGYSTPRCVLIIPLIFNEITQGVIELASFKELEDYELKFVEKVGHSIASALSSVKVNSKTQVLLNQSEQLTSKMKVQEEEMRVNVEELRLTQEESQRREEEHLREISRLKKRLEEYERNF